MFVVSGTAPPDMAEIVLKLIIKTPHKNLFETNIAKIDKDYFSSKFIVHFDEPGTYNKNYLTSILKFKSLQRSFFVQRCVCVS